MTIEERTRIAEQLFEEAVRMMQSKGKSYASDNDALSNFKEVARAAGITKYHAWLAYFLKHVESISNAIKNNPHYPVDGSEGMNGRIIDIICYAAILQAMMVEAETEKASGPVRAEDLVWVNQE